MERPSTNDKIASRAAREKVKKKELVYVKISTILLQSQFCSFSGLEMTSKRLKGVVFLGSSFERISSGPMFFAVSPQAGNIISHRVGGSVRLFVHTSFCRSICHTLLFCAFLSILKEHNTVGLTYDDQPC